METTPVAGVRNLTQLEAAERARLLNVTAYDITLDLTDGTGGPGDGTFRCVTEVRFTCDRAGGVDVHRGRRGAPALGAAERGRGRHVGLVGGEGPHPRLARRGQHPRGRCRLPLLELRPGAAPFGRPGRQRGLPVQPVRDRGRPAGVRLLRPARSEERLHLARHGRVALEGRVERARRTDRPGRRRGQLGGPLRHLGDHEHLHHRPVRRARTTRSGTPTTASTSASTSASR